jgi:hypothetical protein
MRTRIFICAACAVVALAGHVSAEATATAAVERPLLAAARGAILPDAPSHRLTSWETKWRNLQSTVVTRRQRSKRRVALVGAAIGGIAGLAAGAYASRATGGDVDAPAIVGFAAAGAGAGAIAGFVFALF